MVVRIITGGNTKNININNNLLLNRASFSVIKMSLSVHYPPIMKLDYDSIRPVILSMYEYSKNHPEFNFVEVSSKDGKKVYISF